MTRALALAALLLAACGTVTADPDAGGAGGQLGTGGAGGQAVAASGGQGGRPTSAAGGAAGTPTTSAGGAAGAAEPCVGSDTAGLALNIDEPCSVEDAAACSYKTGRCCYAACTLNGAPFVGCIEGSAVASRCYASCSDCP